MTLRRKQPYGAIDQRALAEFERALPAALPPDFRAFLVDSNGAEFRDCTNFGDVPGGTELETVFGLHAGPPHFRLDAMRATLRNAVPPSLLVFAADPFGNYFAMSLVGTDRGAVYFVDHETLPTSAAALQRVARSFSELVALSGAEPAPDAPALSVRDAIASGDASALERLVGAGASTEGTVHAAVHHGDLRILRVVLEHGGDANERGGIGGSETPLFPAARLQRADMTELLLAHGADPNARCSEGGTAMEMAAYSEPVLIVLTRAGAEPTTPHLRRAVERIRGMR